MKQLTNQMCRERGLTIAEKGKHFDGSEIEKGEVIAWNKDKYNLFRQQVRDSFVADCAMAVLKALENCISKEKFIEKMKQLRMECELDRKDGSTSRFRIRMERKCVTAIYPKHSIWTSARRAWRMNLMEISERIQSRSRTETNGSDDVFSWTTTDKLEAAMRQAAGRNRWRKLTAERDDSAGEKVSRRVNEFIQEFQERTDTDVER